MALPSGNLNPSYGITIDCIPQGDFILLKVIPVPKISSLSRSGYLTSLTEGESSHLSRQLAIVLLN